MAEINITNAKTAWISPVVYGALLIVVGVLMAVFQKDALRWILIGSGVLMIIGNAIAIVSIVKNAKVVPIMPIISVVIGVVLVLLPGLMADIVMVLLGIGLVLYGILSVLAAAGAAGKSTLHVVLFGVIGVLSVALGIYTFFHLDDAADVTMIVIGVMTAFIGAIQVLGGINLYTRFH